MKRIIVLLACGLFSTAIFAQEQTEFNQWSIELQAGVHKPGRPFSAGYYTSTPSFFQGDLGIRYMFTNRFGLKLSAGYHSIENNDEGSLPFKTTYMRYSLQGVVNAGDILHFKNWTHRLNFLVHGGAGVSTLAPKEPIEKDAEMMGHFIVGITPQLKLTNSIVLTGDFSMIGNIRQDFTWDGSRKNRKRGFDGMMVTGSLGLTFYLGNATEHADWYGGATSTMGAEIDSLSQRMAKVEDDMIDSDQDGIPNYLDKEPNTVNGVAVNSKGVAVDKNNNNIPDELEKSLDERYSSTNNNNNTMGGGGMISSLLNDGYVNVYFKFNSTQPETYSLEAINYCITYMKNNPNAQAELIGYADEIGNVEYNQQLSLSRAQKVMDIMVAAGIDAARLSVTGNGEDASVDKSSQPARQLVRRVTFRLK